MITQKLTKDFQCTLKELKYLKFQEQNDGYRVSLIDEKGYAILYGYGASQVEALNDLHNNLI